MTHSDAPPTVGEAATRLSWYRATASDAEHLAHRDALIAAVRREEAARVDAALETVENADDGSRCPDYWAGVNAARTAVARLAHREAGR